MYRGVSPRNSSSVDLLFLKFTKNAVSRGIQNKTYSLTNLLFVLGKEDKKTLNVYEIPPV